MQIQATWFYVSVLCSLGRFVEAFLVPNQYWKESLASLAFIFQRAAANWLGIS
jgi:hypothetical protein